MKCPPVEVCAKVGRMQKRPRRSVAGGVRAGKNATRTHCNVWKGQQQKCEPNQNRKSEHGTKLEVNSEAIATCTSPIQSVSMVRTIMAACLFCQGNVQSMPPKGGVRHCPQEEYSTSPNAIPRKHCLRAV